METFSINGVEVFSVGNWNGDDYTREDLQEMVNAFDETKSGIRPFVKIGHSPKQELLKKESLPAAGWVENLYVKGDKLVADFTDVPKKIYQLIQKKAFRKVSSEIFINLKMPNKTYKKVLGAVALLGAETPGVYNLADIIATYSKVADGSDLKIDEETALEIKVHSLTILNHEGDVMTKTENEIKLELELKAKQDEATKLSEQTKQFEADIKAQGEELESLKKFKATAEAEKQELLQAAEVARVAKFVTELKSEKLCTPAMETMITELLGPEKKEFTIKYKKNDKEEEKKYSKDELLKETLKLFKAAADVNFEESSTAGDEGSKASNDEEIEKQAKEYAATHKVTFGAALKAIFNNKK